MSFAEFHWMGGTLFMTVLSMSLTAIIAITILNIIRLSKKNYNPENQYLVIKDISAIGVFAIVWGVFGQSIGLFSALQAIESTPYVPSAMIFGGIKVSFITTLYGTFIFLVSWIITFIMTIWNTKKSL